MQIILLVVYFTSTGLNCGLGSSASQCFLAVGTVMGSLLECSTKLRDVLLSSTDIVSQLVCQLKELRHVLQVDQVCSHKHTHIYICMYIYIIIIIESYIRYIIYNIYIIEFYFICCDHIYFNCSLVYQRADLNDTSYG